jgi:ADP-ribose pyrophosphatase YjhB (NUDIX family)
MVKKYQPYANGQNDLRRGVEFIGVSCAFICHDGKGRILLGKRSQNCRDEQGTWDFGGGSHEFGATLVQTVKREIKEEYGVKAADLKFIKVYDAHRQLADGTPTHWVVALFAAKVDPAKVKNNEPYKIDEIGWFKPDQLPESMHSQAAHNIKSAILIKAI